MSAALNSVSVENLPVALLWAAIAGAGFWILDRLVRRFGPEQHYAGGSIIVGGAILSGLAAILATPIYELIPLVLFAGMSLSEILVSGRRRG